MGLDAVLAQHTRQGSALSSVLSNRAVHSGRQADKNLIKLMATCQGSTGRDQKSEGH